MSLSKPVRYLMDWFIRYLKNRDLYFKKIAEIKEDGNIVIVEQKDSKSINNHVYSFSHDLESEIKNLTEDHKGIVIYNTRENFKFILDNWQRLVDMGDLTVYLVNPFSKLEKKWILKPFIHGRVSEPEAIKTGLKTMYETVDPITLGEIEQLTS